MHQCLIIDENALAALNGLREHAEANPFALDELHLMITGQVRPVGDRPGFCVTLPVGVRCVFSLEEHPKCQYRHLSVSVQGRTPAAAVVQQVMELLGFVNVLGSCALVLDPVTGALNVLEPTATVPLPAGQLVPSPS